MCVIADVDAHLWKNQCVLCLEPESGRVKRYVISQCFIGALTGLKVILSAIWAFDNSRVPEMQF